MCPLNRNLSIKLEYRKQMNRIRKIYKLAGALLFLLFSLPVVAAENEVQEEPFNPQKTIFEHLGDEYGWRTELAGGNHIDLPLPVIVRDFEGEWHLFSSSKIKDGKNYRGFYIAGEGENESKIESLDNMGNRYRPIDLSITKNVFALIICGVVTFFCIYPVARWYKRREFKAPRKGIGAMEFIIDMMYREVIVPVLGEDARRFAPYLLTLFFFILISNLLGMIVIFPGGANLMGNISITCVLAVCTFLIVNFSGSKTYWKEVFWPDVPLWLKFPIPIMPLIEVFGLFTKPMALMVRLFANMLGGHLITLVLISLIFLFGTMGTAVVGATTFVSVLFSFFMGLIDLLICFIQAYVFMLLSTLFISLARVKEEKIKE